MTDSCINPLLTLAYDKWFMINDKILVGYTKPKFDKSFDVDIIAGSELFSIFRVTGVSFIKERYLVLSLMDNEESEIEVFDTLTKQKLTDKVYEKQHHKMTAGFVCDDEGMPYVTIYSDEEFGRCLILSTEFEIINSKAIMISKTSCSDNLYHFDASFSTSPPKWVHVVMHKVTGEILQETDID